MGRSRQCGNVVASQSTKDVASDDLVGLQQIAGSRCKGEIADLVLTINRSTEQTFRGETTIACPKFRNGRSGWMETIPTDLERMQFYCPKAADAAVDAA